MASRTILLIEDNLDDEAFALRAFRKNNILNPVTVVRDGAAALDHLSPGNSAAAPLPTIVLLDLNLPRIGGLEVLRRLRSVEWTRFLPVIVLTGSIQEEDILASYRAGANAYIRKALKFADFAEAIRVLGTFWLQLNEVPLRETAGLGRQMAAR